ncbi:hypothetical protein [Bacillus smithii]|uniref:hypothetical protein n=1 Tax=Bacillus smithii TaxID=1479 RepID=UPI002E2066DB|nr:hypothetical protein [Bacillus smithii]MED1457527.1 hypothetical protein [Bacillus smithii]
MKLSAILSVFEVNPMHPFLDFNRPSKFIIKVAKETTGTPISPEQLKKYKELFKPIPNVRPNQAFSISFTTELDRSTVNKETVFVLNKKMKKWI